MYAARPSWRRSFLALFGVACSDGGEAVEVLAAEEIFASDITIEPDPTGTSATLLLTTELDMACAVVYGTTEELGDGLATDTDMGAGAHSDHSAVMLDLQPDTEYFYRVQGSAVGCGRTAVPERTYDLPDPRRGSSLHAG